MKKIFLLLSVLASSLCMNAQNIKYVELTQDGVFTPPQSATNGEMLILLS